MVAPGGYSFQNQTASSAQAGGDTRLAQGGISFGSYRPPGSIDGRSAAIAVGVLGMAIGLALIASGGLDLIKKRKG